jgi:Fis family transcriptional regulator
MSLCLAEVTESNTQIKHHVITVAKSYLNGLPKKDKGNNINLYDKILENVEAPLLRTVMEQTRYNQSKAARILGISRGTLRTKLKQYFNDEFID